MLLKELLREFGYQRPFIRNMIYRTPILKKEITTFISEHLFSFSETFCIAIAKSLQDAGLRNLLIEQVITILLQVKDWSYVLEAAGYVDTKKFFIAITKVLPRVRIILERSLIGSGYNIIEKGEQQLLPMAKGISDRMLFVGEMPFIYQEVSIYVPLFKNLIEVNEKWRKYQK